MFKELFYFRHRSCNRMGRSERKATATQTNFKINYQWKINYFGGNDHEKI